MRSFAMSEFASGPRAWVWARNLAAHGALVLALSALGFGCSQGSASGANQANIEAATRSSALGTATLAGRSTPRPAGVTLVPPPPLPQPRSTGQTASTLLVLATPDSRTRVHAVLRRFFEALSQESAEALSVVLEPNAVAHFAGGSSTSALGSWLRRFTRADYRALTADSVFHPSRLDTFSRLDVEGLRDSRAFPLVPDPSELLAQVTIDDPDIALLGSRMSFVLRPHPGGYRIKATFEELAP